MLPSFKTFLESADVAQAEKIAKQAGLVSRELGKEIVLINEKQIKGQPNVLVAAAFHGDEPSGVSAILEVLKHPEWLKGFNASFLPIANPSGYSRHTRTDKWGKNVNRGFIHGKNKLSKEGQVMKDHLGEISKLAKDGFLTLHEDDRYDEFYLYIYNNSELDKLLMDVGGKFFKKGKTHRDEHDGSFEDLLSHEGIVAVCTEVPGKATLAEKTKCNIELIKAFFGWVKS